MCNKNICSIAPKPHKHAAIIKQWADNPNIKLQWFNTMEDKWYDMSYTPVWNSSKVRIKPEPTPDIVLIREACLDGATSLMVFRQNPNVRFTFDGETYKLKSVEMI